MARFAVSNLHPGSVYIISIYAFNSKGRSDPAVLPAAMLRPAEKQLTAEKGEIFKKKNFLNNLFWHSLTRKKINFSSILQFWMRRLILQIVSFGVLHFFDIHAHISRP